MGYLRISLITDQSECLICYFLCTELTLFCNELTLFCIELPENCIYLNQSELSNFSMYIIKNEIFRFLNLHLPLSVYCRYQDWFQKLMPCQLYLSTDWKHQNLSGDENLDISSWRWMRRWSIITHSEGLHLSSARIHCLQLGAFRCAISSLVRPFLPQLKRSSTMWGIGVHTTYSSAVRIPSITNCSISAIWGISSFKSLSSQGNLRCILNPVFELADKLLKFNWKKLFRIAKKKKRKRKERKEIKGKDLQHLFKEVRQILCLQFH